MKIKTPIGREQLRTHLTYNGWAYAIIVAASILGWNLLYTMTAYRSPENLRIDLYIQSDSATEESVEAFLQPIWKESVPEMETVSAVLLSGNTATDYYAGMRLSTYLMAGEGDIYCLSTSDFKSFAAQGVFLDLEPFITSGALNVGEIDLSSGYVALVDDEGRPAGEKALYGIPAYTLDGYRDGMLVDNHDLVLCVTNYNGNEENVMRFLDALIAAGYAPQEEAP